MGEGLSSIPRVVGKPQLKNLWNVISTGSMPASTFLRYLQGVGVDKAGDLAPFPLGRSVLISSPPAAALKTRDPCATIELTQERSSVWPERWSPKPVVAGSNPAAPAISSVQAGPGNVRGLSLFAHISRYDAELNPHSPPNTMVPIENSTNTGPDRGPAWRVQ